MTSYNRDKKVGPWAEDKLSCLEKYLAEYTRILRNQARWCKGFYYVDAFAGRGLSEIRRRESSTSDEYHLGLAGYSPQSDEEAEYIRGSTLRALDLDNPFTGYLFIDNDPDRIVRLKKLERDHPRKNLIRVKEGDANKILTTSLVHNPDIDWSNHRAVVFLDPFGMQVPWATIQALASTKAIEVFINFPVGTTLQRLLPKSGKFSSESRHKLDDYFGTIEWWDILYRKRATLFGSKIEKVSDSGRVLVTWYAERLRSIFGYVASPRLIRNPSGGHLYYLIFAGPNETGAKIADHIMKQGEAIKIP